MSDRIPVLVALGPAMLRRRIVSLWRGARAGHERGAGRTQVARDEASLPLLCEWLAKVKEARCSHGDAIGFVLEVEDIEERWLLEPDDTVIFLSWGSSLPHPDPRGIAWAELGRWLGSR